MDVWSLAATLLEGWTGKLPYDWVDEAQMFHNFIRGTPPSLEFQARPLPSLLAALLARCFSFDAAARPSAQALHEELCALCVTLECNPSEALPSTSPQPAASARVAGTYAVKPVYLEQCALGRLGGSASAAPQAPQVEAPAVLKCCVRRPPPTTVLLPAQVRLPGISTSIHHCFTRAIVKSLTTVHDVSLSDWRVQRLL